MSAPNARPKSVLIALALVGLAALAAACGDARYRAPSEPNGHRSPAQASSVTLPTTTAQGDQGSLAGGVVATPLGVQAASAKYRLVNTALTPGTRQ